MPYMPSSGLDPSWVYGTNQDRKSTRLNSSHQIISYAVFCLKKKKHAAGIAPDKTKFDQITAAIRRLSQTLGDERYLPVSEKGLSFFFNDTAATEIYTLSLHDALPI